ncbi:MAG: M23 family metallopeptidase [Chloroflexota bacterium]|nr:M23 family metallopeptidase [Chloroflexota bacterium]
MKVSVRRLVWRVFLLAAICFVLPGAAHATEPNYALPGQFALPWSCGEGYEITWGPEGHWAQHKATGIAFDFSMEAGTPLFAPIDGRAYFLRDERLLETNYGNYVEIVTKDGNWLVRLAHLQDAQSGERDVKTGDLVAHSGSSGVPAAHLHVELLEKEGKTWRCPDYGRLERLFGLPLTLFTEGAIIHNRGCPAKVVVGGPIRADAEVTLGEMVRLSVPLRNDGLGEALLDDVHVLLAGPADVSGAAQVHGPWTLDGKASLTIEVPFQPTVSGPWAVRGLAYVMDGQPRTVEAGGEITVAPSSLHLSQVRAPSHVGVGEDITLTVQIENVGEKDHAFDDLVLEGERPDGKRWTACVGMSDTLGGGEKGSFVLRSAVVPQDVGVWRGMHMGYDKGGKTFYFDEVACSFPVEGPELRADNMRTYVASDILRIFLQVSNVGTAPVHPDCIEVWGWEPDGEHTFSAKQEAPAPLEPGGGTLLQFDVPMGGVQGTWALVEAGYWTKGDYYTIPIPRQGMVRHEGIQPP